MLTMTRRRSAAGMLASVALVLTGCGGDASSPAEEQASDESAPPQQRVAAAFSALTDEQAISGALKLDFSSADLMSAAPPEDPIEQRIADLVTGSRLSFALASPDDKPLKDYLTVDPSADAPQGLSQFALEVDGGAIVEFRSLNKTLYARADVPKIVELAEQDPSTLDQFKSGDLPPELSFVRDAVEGRWLQVPADDLTKLGQQLGGPSASATPDPASVRRFLEALKGVYNKDVQVRAEGDGGDRGDRFVLTGSSRALATDLVKAISDLQPGNPALSSVDPAEVPDREIVVEAFVKDGAINVLSLDLAQFADGEDAARLGDKRLPIVLEMSREAPEIVAPTDAVLVDVAALMQILGGQAGTA